MTRKQLAEHFDRDGRLIFVELERYYLRDTRLRRRENTVVMMDFVFKPAAMDEVTFADPEKKQAWYRKRSYSPLFSGDPNDILKAFSKPYESGLGID